MYLLDIYNGDGVQGSTAETYTTQAEAIREAMKVIRAETGKWRNKRLKRCYYKFYNVEGSIQTPAIIAWGMGYDGFIAVFEIPRGMENYF